VTRESKKEREVRYVRLFQRLRADAPQAEPSPGERPDFTIAIPGGIVGLEVTEYYRPHVPNPNLRHSRPLQEQDALKNQIAERAQELFSAKFDRRVRVQLLFRPLDIVDGREVEELATAIADLVGSLPLIEEHVRFVPSREHSFPRQLTTVFAQVVAPDRYSYWEVVAAGSVVLLEPAHIIAIVLDKDSKLRNYRRDLAEAWLLIVQDYWSRASYAELSPEALNTIYESGFARIYFLRVFQSECVSLAVRQRISPPAA
jgi:hypothetical protein